MNEAAMRQRVVKALRSIHAVSIEMGGASGVPDINHLFGWIETKRIDAWPRRPETAVPLPKFYAAQRIWIRARADAVDDENKVRHIRCAISVLLRVGLSDDRKSDWLLLPGRWAADYLGRNTNRRQLVANSVKVWEGGLDDAELLYTIRNATQ